MAKPLISILIPFKNTSEFLAECLESIINQTNSHWEVLIVDDHSTDDSYHLVKQYTDADNRIKLFKNTGQGIIETLRLAFSKSSGDYITRMDSDDLMAPEKLEVLSANLQTFGKGHIATGLVQYFSKDGINDGYARYETWLNTLTKQGTNYSEIYKECVIASPCWMVHRDDLIACEAFNPNRYPEDYDLVFRFYKHGLNCIPCNAILHHWRDYSHRTSRTHEHYSQNYFLEIKLHYFLELDYNPSRPLTLWGAGFKGKTLAKILIQNRVPFHWICNNPKKIGKAIYNETLHPFDYLEQLQHPQTLITVANEASQAEIKAYFKLLNAQPATDYFFFC